MKFAYFIVTNNRRLDVVDITADRVTYDTGAAREMVEGKIGAYGHRGAIDVLQSWSNGYVSTRKMD
jgi:hypothetical protein